MLVVAPLPVPLLLPATVAAVEVAGPTIDAHVRRAFRARVGATVLVAIVLIGA